MKKSLRILSFCFVLLFAMQGFFAVPTAAANDGITENIQSEYALTVNIDTGTVLYEKHSGNGNFCYCGFLARLMTAAILLEEATKGTVNLSDKVTLTAGMLAQTPKRKVDTFAAGNKVTLEDLVKSLLIANAQEAAVAIAVYLSGSTEAFVKRINEKAQELGMTQTTVTNVHGYFDGGNPGWTTLEDVAKAVKYALDQDKFKDFTNPGKEPTYITVSGASKPLYFSNQILSSTTKYYNKKAVGIAAASSDNCTWYAACDMVMDGTQRLVSIVISLKDLGTAWTDINALLKLSTEKYKTLTVVQQNAILTKVAVTRGKTRDSVNAVVNKTIYCTVPEDVTANDFSYELDIPESVQAPVTKGDVLGTAKFYDQNGKFLEEITLTAQTDVAANEIELFTDELNAFFDQKTVWLVLGAVILIMILYIILSNRKKPKHKQRSRVRLRR